MENSIKYKVQDKFIICFDSNEIYADSKDKQQKRNKVEPRIMDVLQILIAHQPKLVTREYIIKKVWNDYPSADDALNQAISHLRKVLGDHDRENRVIETVTKKGYQFKGMIRPLTEEKLKYKRISISKNLIFIIIGFLIFLIVIVILYFEFFPKEATAPLAPGK